MSKPVVDTSELMDFIDNLSIQKTIELYRKGIKKSAQILRNETIRQFSQDFHYKGAWKQEVTRKSGKKKIKTREVAKVTSKTRNGDVTVKVHIMEDYRVKWLEMGTKKRFTKGYRNVGYFKLRNDSNRKYIARTGKPLNRGTIQPGKFFEEARRKKMKEVESSIQDNIENVVKQTLIRSKK